jgi:DNA-binding NtrC family response regulator
MTETPPCVMIVEVDMLVRAPLAAYLRECGYRVVEASSPDEAKVLLDAEEVPVDIVLAEGTAGFALAGWIREHHPAVDIILAGTVERAAAKAGELCEEGPAESVPFDHQFVLNEIKRSIAARQRRE